MGKEGKIKMKFQSYPIQHVELKVENLERSISFYKKVIGFSVLEKTEKEVFLTADGETSLLSLKELEHYSPKQGKTTGLYHFAILLPERVYLASILKHFLKQGIELGASDHLVSEALYLSDPDGNGIEVYADRDSSTWKWQNNEVVMDTKPLDGQNLLNELPKDEEWKGLPHKTLIGHIHLHVRNLEEAEKFYKEGLGLDIVTNYGGHALFLSFHRYHHHIGVNVWAGKDAKNPKPEHVGLKSFALFYDTKEQRDKAIERLISLGFHVKEQDDVFTAEDESGNKIKLVF